MLTAILVIIAIVTGGAIAIPRIKRFIRQHQLLKITTVAFAIATGLLAVVELVSFAGTFVDWVSRRLGPSETETIRTAIQNCNTKLDLRCIRAGGAHGAEISLTQLKACGATTIVRSDAANLNWKDIWTTSVYSFQPGGGGPGGGKDDDVLKVGGWGDWYFSLIKFDLPQLNYRPRFVAIALYSKQTEGTSVSLMIDELIHQWDFPKGGTLWWRERPGQRAAIADPLPAPKREQWFIIDITALFDTWTTKRSQNYGLQIRPTHDFGSFVFFTSSDAGDKSKIPQLIICS